MPVAERTKIEVPYAPRQWALELHGTYKRWIALVLHRRAGKSTAVLNHHQRAALDDQWELARLRFLMPGVSDTDLVPLLRGRFYGHVMPSRVQAKMAVWDMLKYYAANIPGAVPNEAELLIRYPPTSLNPSGSRFQLFGADNPDSLRGPGFSGLSFDEYSQQPANIFSEVLSKALADHLGYAMFVGTIKGEDHLYRAYEAGKDDPAWFTLWQDVDRSIATESGITIQMIERAMADERALVLKGQMTQAEFDQEWYLSAEAAIKGAIYAPQLTEARVDGRIGNVPYDPLLPVDTDWDLGIGDATAIWFSQSLRTREVRLIDYYEASGEGLPFYAQILKSKPYVYGEHWAPHDIQVRELGSGRSRIETAASLGIKFQIAPKLPVEEGIHAARMLLPRCWFDSTKTKVGLESLRHYRRDFNRHLQELKATPVHDLYSHGADAFRGLAVRHQPPKDPRLAREQKWMRDQLGATHGWMSG